MRLFLSILIRPGLVSIFSIFVLSSCAHQTKSTSYSDFLLNVTIEPIPGKDSWRATFNSNLPVKELVFHRQVNRFRTKLWRSVTPGISISEQDGEEQIKAPSEFTTATFEFESYYEDTPKDYEFFQAFSDKSVVMYTGHLNACPKGLDCDRPARFTLVPRPNEKGIVAGQVFNETYHWTDESGKGTYVYFGNLKPIVAAQLTALVDPKIPKWLRIRFNDLLPRLFSLYEKKTNQPLTFKPFVFLSYSPEGEGNGSKGGTLPGLIQLALNGKGWNQYDPDSFIDLARFLAHESAHIWNGQLFRYGSGEMWMHEGGADAFAYRALRDLKIVKADRFAEFQTDAFNECMNQLKDRPLRQVTEDPNFTAFYRCGSIFALITEAAIQKKDPKLDLFSFWHEVFEQAKLAGGVYTEQIYFEVLNRMSGEAETSAAIKKLLDGKVEVALDTFLAEFTRLKISFSKIMSHFPQAYNLRVSRGLLRELMKSECSSYGLTQGSKGLATDAFPNCGPFSKPLYVTHLAGLKIVSDGALAYDRIQTGCKDLKYRVEMKARSEANSLFAKCPASLPVREPYIKILAGM